MNLRLRVRSERHLNHKIVPIYIYCRYRTGARVRNTEIYPMIFLFILTFSFLIMPRDLLAAAAAEK